MFSLTSNQNQYLILQFCKNKESVKVASQKKSKFNKNQKDIKYVESQLDTSKQNEDQTQQEQEQGGNDVQQNEVRLNFLKDQQYQFNLNGRKRTNQENTFVHENSNLTSLTIDYLEPSQRNNIVSEIDFKTGYQTGHFKDKIDDTQNNIQENFTSYLTQINETDRNTTDRNASPVFLFSNSKEQGDIEKLLLNMTNSVQDRLLDTIKPYQILNDLDLNQSQKQEEVSKFDSGNSNHQVLIRHQNKHKTERKERSPLKKKCSETYTIQSNQTDQFKINNLTNTNTYYLSHQKSDKNGTFDYFQNQNYEEDDDYEGEDILKKKVNLQGNKSRSSSCEEDNDKYIKKKSNMVAASSIHTSKSINHDQKRLLKSQMFSKKKNAFMVVLTLFGLCSVSVIVSLTLFQYFNIQNQFSIAQMCFTYLPWPMSFRGALVTILQLDAFIKMIQYDAFPGIQDNNYYNTTKAAQLQTVDSLLSLYLEFQNADMTKMTFFYYMLDTQMDFVTSIDDRLSKNPETFNADEKSNRNVTLAYLMHAVSGYVYEYISNINNTLYGSKIILDNFLSFNPYLVNLQTQITQEATNILNDLTQQTLILLILVIVLTLLLIGSIFPIYYFVQVKNEQILKLFATIQPEHLKSMMVQLQMIKEEDVAANFEIQKQASHAKKKSISNTSLLPKYNPIFILYSIISFLIIIIQPLVNYILISNFRVQTLQNINLLTNLYSLKANFISSNAIFFGAIPYFMNIGVELYNLPYYQKRVVQLVTTNQQQLDVMYQYLENSYAISHYNQQYYDDFLYKLIQGNLCEVLQNYPQFISQENQIDNTICTTVYGGILTQGFQFCVKFFLQIFETLQQIIASPNYLQNIQSWESLNKIQNFDHFFNILYKSITIIKDFMLQMMHDQLNMMESIQTILLCFQLCALLFVFLAVWTKFYNLITKEMYEVKSLISILPLEVVLENRYILSYLNK